jgi:hypothetical protein
MSIDTLSTSTKKNKTSVNFGLLNHKRYANTTFQQCPNCLCVFNYIDNASCFFDGTTPSYECPACAYEGSVTKPKKDVL